MSTDGRPDDGLERMASALQQSGRFEVLRRFEPPTRYAPPDGARLGLALAVDVETTGLDHERDRIIQLSAVPFEYALRTGRIYGVGAPLTYFEDPGVPIPDHITHLTGIDDDAVRGQRIDDEAVTRLARQARLVIAHNAAFDRAFLERRLPVFRAKPWACSLTEVPWPAGTAKLEFLMYKQCGLFFGAHRAESDCQALIHLLATPFETGELPMKLLLDSARRQTLRIWATGAPFIKKDLLKERRYQWFPGDDNRAKGWYRDLPEADGPAEMDWLKANVYAGQEPTWEIETIGAERRFSSAR